MPREDMKMIHMAVLLKAPVFPHQFASAWLRKLFREGVYDTLPEIKALRMLEPMILRF